MNRSEQVTKSGDNLLFVLKMNELMRKADEIHHKIASTPSSGLRTQYGRLYFKVSLIRSAISVCCVLNESEDYTGKSRLRHDKLLNMTRAHLSDFIRAFILNTESIRSFLSISPDDRKRILGKQTTFDCTSIFVLVDRQIATMNEWLHESICPVQTKGVGCQFEDITWSQYAKITIAHALDLNEKNVMPLLNEHFVGDMLIRRLFYCIAFEALLIHFFDPTYYPVGFGEDDAMYGESDIPRYFDGILTLRESSSNRSYICKVYSLSISDAMFITNMCTSIRDVRSQIETVLNGELNAIAFVPGYRSSDILERQLYWRGTQEVNLHVFYLEDLFEMFKLWEGNLVRRYIVERLKY